MKKRYILVMVFTILLIIKILFAIGTFQLNKTYDLTEKFGITGNILGYGVYEAESYEEFISKIEEIYIREKEEGRKVYFVYGDENKVEIVNYEEINLGKINFISGEVTSNLKINEDKYVSRSVIPEDNRVRFIIKGENYEFKLRPNEKIYFIISEDAK